MRTPQAHPERLLLTALILSVACAVCLPPARVHAETLPDRRAWEMVSPLDKNGGIIRGIDGVSGGGVVQASAEGNEITYLSLAAFGNARGAPLGSQYVADRDAQTGWLTQNITTPLNAQTYSLGTNGAPYDAFSSDLSSGLVSGGERQKGGVENPPLASGAPAGYENYYLGEIPGGALQPLLTFTPDISPGEFKLEFQGTTPDLSNVVVSTQAALGPDTIQAGEGESNLYEWGKATGQFQPVNILPDGTPDPGHRVLFGNGLAMNDHAISSNGSSVVWTGGQALYVRENIGTQQARTVQVDAPAGDGSFLTASSDGSRIFFADSNRLTAESTASGGGQGDLYRFEPGQPEGERLVDLTVDHADAGGAELQGVLGASENGSYIYFVANGVLAPGASLGDCAVNEERPAATCNLYLWHEGEPTRFIATLANNDTSRSGLSGQGLGVAFDWESSIGLRTARVSHDGTNLIFMSERSLTNYDNTVSAGDSCGQNGHNEPLSAQCEEVYLYGANTNRLSCVSCNPSGARPIGPSGIPGGTEFSTNRASYQSRVLSEGEDSGRVIFDSADALVPQDTNGEEDVYEYEDGHIYLLSGSKSAPSAFVDASVNGNDVFFITRVQLVSQDTDQLTDLYDARAPHTPGEVVGFPEPPPPAPCEDEDCRTASPPAPVFVLPSSVSISGGGNIVPTASAPMAKIKPKKVKSRKRKKSGRRKRARAGGGKAIVRRGK